MSLVLPAGNVTTIRTGVVGYDCALAIRDTAGSAAAPATRRRNLRRGSFRFVMRVPFTFLHPPDATAISMARDYKLPLIFFSLDTDGTIVRVVSGEKIGTIVHS